MNILEIANKIKEAGGTLYLVGGAIRDEIMGNTIYDKDYCITGISKEKFQELFPEAHVRGKSFEVFDIENIEFALARIEKKIGRGHKEFKIETRETITIEEDLARRDITINAIAKNVLTEEIIDPFKGRKDIENKIIRATTNAFKEDPLRVYRVARFAAKTGFEVEQNTLKLMEGLKEELKTLSKERVFQELEKALKTCTPSIFFNVLKQANVLEVHFEEIYNLIGALQPEEYHPEGDSYNHTMIVVDKSAELTEDTAIRFAALVHDLGKGITPKEMYPHHYGHDKKGVQLVENLGKRIGAPKKWISYGKVAAEEHRKGGIFNKMTPAKKISFIERVSKSKLGLDGLQIIVISDRYGTINKDNEENKENEFNRIGKQCLEQINGRYIKEKYNIKEGIKIKEKLHQERIKWLKEKMKIIT